MQASNYLVEENLLRKGLSAEIYYFGKNDLIHVPIGMKHAVRADCGEKIISVGGPSPADKHLLKNVGKLPKKYEF